MTIPAKPRGPQRRSLETRERLVDAALNEFTEKGFDGASTRGIAARAGVAQSALPYHFTTKDALWKATAERIFSVFQEQFASRVSGLDGVDLPTRVRLLVLDFVRFAAAHPELHRFMLDASSGPSDRLAWLVDTHVRPTFLGLRALFEEIEASGYRVPARMDHLWYMLIGATSTPYVLAPEFELIGNVDPFAEDLVEAHAEAVLRAFFPEFADPKGVPA